MSPIFAPLHCRWPGGIGFLLRFAAEDGGNTVCLDCDQADGTLTFERAKPLDDASGGKAETRRTRRFDRNKVAVFCVGGRARRDRKLLADHFFLDWLQPAATVLDLPEDPEHPLLGVIDDLDDPATMAD